MRRLSVRSPAPRRPKDWLAACCASCHAHARAHRRLLLASQLRARRQDAPELLARGWPHVRIHLQQVVGVEAVRHGRVVGRVCPHSVHDELVLVLTKQHLTLQLPAAKPGAPLHVERVAPADVEAGDLDPLAPAVAVHRDADRHRAHAHEHVGRCGADGVDLGAAATDRRHRGIRLIDLHAARPAHICDRGRWRAPHARGAVHICGAAGGGVRARQRRHGVGQLLPQVKRVKVVHAEAHVAHAQLLAPRLDRLDVEVEVGHVGVLLQAEDELDALLLKKVVDVLCFLKTGANDDILNYTVVVEAQLVLVGVLRSHLGLHLLGVAEALGLAVGVLGHLGSALGLGCGRRGRLRGCAATGGVRACHAALVHSRPMRRCRACWPCVQSAATTQQRSRTGLQPSFPLE
mmetsp:Transcript_13274/g.38580  ORF Transcript_13274/g.38580 Transcript_13274/m.38580 type:complete len:404 (-) Transcript_13274:106-1317(-)